MLSSKDTSLSQAIRNILSKEELDIKLGMESASDNHHRVMVELRIAKFLEENYPQWGQAIPYDPQNRSRGIVNHHPPLRYHFKASFAIESSAYRFSGMSEEEALENQIRSVAYEMMGELDHLINGRELLYYPCLPCYAYKTMSSRAYEPCYQFTSLHYFVRPNADFPIDINTSPEVPVTKPSEKFMKRLFSGDMAHQFKTPYPLYPTRPY